MAWNYNVWAPKIMESNEMSPGKYQKNSLKIYRKAQNKIKNGGIYWFTQTKKNRPFPKSLPF
jgi:hypothetical protein